MGGRKRKKSSSGNANGFGKKSRFDAFAKAKSNPFDVQNNKRNKQVVLGRKIKGKSRDVSKAKQREGQIRDDTLLEQLKKRGKANAFVDKRFGEARSDITQEERDLSRFIKLQKSRLKKNKYNLGDDNDNDMHLTHGGKPLNSQQLGDYRGKSEEDDEGAGGSGLTGLSAEIVNQMHFGGGNLKESFRPDGTKKTKEEIYSELIAKSKQYKAERRRQKDLDEQEMEQLDDQLDDIRSMLDFKPSKAEEKKQMMNSLLDKYNLGKGGSQGTDKTSRTVETKEDEYDDYDSMRRELTYEMRVAATDRMKTDEEKAKEEKEKLEKLEKERLRRMEMDVDNSASSKKEQNESNTGDGLGVNFEVDDTLMQSSEEDIGDDDEDVGIEDDILTSSAAGATELSSKEYDPEVPMPFTFACPSNRRELKETIAQWAPPDRNDTGTKLKLLFGRILKYNSIHLGADNRSKLQALFTLMLEYLCKLKSYPKCSLYLDVYAKIMYRLMQIGPEHAANAYRILLTNIQRRASHHTVRARATASTGGGGDYGVIDKKRRAWPSGGELIALKMLGNLFPLSDFRHAVTTPASILLGQLLSQCPVRGPKDLAAGIFCSGLQLYYSESSRRLAPEALNFLMSSVGKSYLDYFASTNKKSKGTRNIGKEELEGIVYRIVSSCPPIAASNLGWVFRRLTPKDSKAKEIGKLSLDIFFDNNKKQEFKGSKQSAAGIEVLNTALLLLKQFVKMHSSSTSLPEMILPLTKLLPAVVQQSQHNIKNFPAEVSKLQKTVQHSILESYSLSLKSRRLLQMQKEIQRPKAIKSYRPMFDEEYIVRKDNDPNRERAEIKKLKRQIARERKGAAREIKKDSLYVARKQHEEREEWEADVQKKYNNVIDFLDKQQSGFKKAIKEGTMHGGGMKAGRRKKKIRAV